MNPSNHIEYDKFSLGHKTTCILLNSKPRLRNDKETLEKLSKSIDFGLNTEVDPKTGQLTPFHVLDTKIYNFSDGNCGVMKTLEESDIVVHKAQVEKEKLPLSYDFKIDPLVNEIMCATKKPTVEVIFIDFYTCRKPNDGKITIDHLLRQIQPDYCEREEMYVPVKQEYFLNGMNKLELFPKNKTYSPCSRIDNRASFVAYGKDKEFFMNNEKVKKSYLDLLNSSGMNIIELGKEGKITTDHEFSPYGYTRVDLASDKNGNLYNIDIHTFGEYGCAVIEAEALNSKETVKPIVDATSKTIDVEKIIILDPKIRFITQKEKI